MIDIGQLSAPELIAAVNDRNGDILNPRRLKNHRDDGGERFYANRLYSLPAYIGWLHDKVTAKLKARADVANSEAAQYERHKLRMAERSRTKSLAARDIGEIPDCLHPEDVKRCRFDLALFCETFFPLWFFNEFCDQHLEVIQNIQQIVLQGGMQAMAMPRHRGKTVITKAACLWAALYGHRKYTVWLAAQDKMAGDAVDDFWSVLRSNQKLVDAFPAACHPLVMGGADQRSRPLYHGRELQMGRRDLKIILPDIEGSPSSSNIIEAGGIMVAVRGLHFVRNDGTVCRPDLIVLDDPQTDEVALSDGQCDKRETIITQAVLGLSGPGVKIAAVMPCTIIREGDLSSRLLDREKNPEWHGIIGKAVVADGERPKKDTDDPLHADLPINMGLWEKYNKLRIKSLNETNTIRYATEFYAKNRAAMDVGCLATWEEDFNADEISAIQHEMNIFFQSPTMFFAERQNSPMKPAGVIDQLKKSELIERVSDLQREMVPPGSDVITAFVDLHSDVLYWMVVAWNRRFSGQIISYGTWPDQESAYFEKSKARKKLENTDECRGKSLDTQLQIALTQIFEYLDRDWHSEDGTLHKLTRGMIDGNWVLTTAAADRFCRVSKWRGRVHYSRGEASIEKWVVRETEYRGDHWMKRARKKTEFTQSYAYSTNAWKTRVAQFLRAKPGGDASIVFHKPDGQYDHRMPVDHFCAESCFLRDNTEDDFRWENIRDQDNHFWDCLIGNAVVASVCGVSMPQLEMAKPIVKPVKRRQRVHYGEWARE